MNSFRQLATDLYNSICKSVLRGTEACLGFAYASRPTGASWNNAAVRLNTISIDNMFGAIVGTELFSAICPSGHNGSFASQWERFCEIVISYLNSDRPNSSSLKDRGSIPDCVMLDVVPNRPHGRSYRSYFLATEALSWDKAPGARSSPLI
jgi:hypothetical protein